MATTLTTPQQPAVTGGEDSHGHTERNRRCLEHLDLVREIAEVCHWRTRAPVEVDDMISAGYVGLIAAAERFDPSRGIGFRTYASARIRGAIIDMLREEDVVGRADRSLIRRSDRVRHDFAAHHGRFPTQAETATATGCSTDELRATLQRHHQFPGLPWHTEFRYRDNERGITLDELVPEREPDHLPLDPDERNALHCAVMRLTAREQFVLTTYYWEHCTLKQIGELLGVTESRVSQIKSHAERRLRALLEPEFRSVK